MLTFGFGFWEYWELRQKVTFDGRLSLVVVNPDVTEIDVQTDVYSAWKRWALVESNLKYAAAIRTIGGDATTAGQKAGDIYFMINRWRLVIDLGVTRMTGVLFSDDFESPLLSPSGAIAYQSLVSSLVTGVTELPKIRERTDRIPDVPASQGDIIALS